MRYSYKGLHFSQMTDSELDTIYNLYNCYQIDQENSELVEDLLKEVCIRFY